jgi:hypothetical protein
MVGCNLSSGRFSYTTIGQSIKQQNSEGNALRMREIVLRSPTSIPLRFTAEGGVSFRVAPRLPHSEELARRLDELERKYDVRFRVVFDALRKLMQPPETKSRRVGFRVEASEEDKARMNYGSQG